MAHPSAESTAALQHGLRQTTWTTRDLYVAALGVGGALRFSDVDAIAAGVRPASPEEHDIMATALNDWIVDHGGDHPVALWSHLAA